VGLGNGGEGTRMNESIIERPDRRRNSALMTIAPGSPSSPPFGFGRLTSAPSGRASSPKLGSTRDLSRARFLTRTWERGERVKIEVER
jgi:hypothetical protein